MEDVDVPNPNPFITKWLKGPECKKLVTRQGNRALVLYRSIVAKRSGDLAKSAHVVVELGGLKSRDRWTATLVADMPYAASHEYGTGRTNPDHAQAAAHDMAKVLDGMDFG